MKYLINNTMTYRVATVDDALALRDELSASDYGELVNFSYTTKQIKVKGEVVEEYQLVKAKLNFNVEKDPDDSTIDVMIGRPGVSNAF